MHCTTRHVPITIINYHKRPLGGAIRMGSMHSLLLPVQVPCAWYINGALCPLTGNIHFSYSSIFGCLPCVKPPEGYFVIVVPYWLRHTPTLGERTFYDQHDRTRCSATARQPRSQRKLAAASHVPRQRQGIIYYFPEKLFSEHTHPGHLFLLGQGTYT